MKRTIKISASFTGTIPTGRFENEKPFYAVEELIEESEPNSICDGMIEDRQQMLHDICYKQFKQQAERSNIERIAKEYQNIRFYPGANGLQYPSVTSIIGWDADFKMPEDELQQYGSRGTIIHKQVEIFLTTGEWKEPKDIPEIYPDLVIVKNGNLGLEVDNVDFRGFYEKYPFEVLELEKTAINDEYRYGGRLDIKCVIKSSQKGSWGKLEGILYDVPTILDVKTGALNKLSGFKQQTAYAMCDPEVQQIGLIHLNKEVKQGYSKPVFETDLNKYKSLFLKDRENFKKRYGV